MLGNLVESPLYSRSIVAAIAVQALSLTLSWRIIAVIVVPSLLLPLECSHHCCHCCGCHVGVITVIIAWASLHERSKELLLAGGVGKIVAVPNGERRGGY